MMFIENKYDFGDIVYLVADAEQFKRVVSGIKVTPSGQLLYILCYGTNTSEHYDFEISLEKDLANV